MRIDQLLVERGLASSRSQAQRLIGSGVQWRAGAPGVALWKKVAKNGDEVPDSAELELLDVSEARYVSRGGLKLEGALLAAQLDVTGLQCLDIGQSTGGFTDCLLQRGAASVVGVDVGSGQVHEKIRTDARVLCIEKCNARELDASFLIAEAQESAPADGLFGAEFEAQFDFLTGDLSFISLTLVLPALVPLLKPGANFLMLVKPQFELQPGQVGKGGIVRDPALYAVVEKRLRDTCAELGLQVRDWFDSPIQGGDGNHEFFIFARRPT